MPVALPEVSNLLRKCSNELAAPFNNGMHPTTNGGAFIRETCFNSAVCARRLSPAVTSPPRPTLTTLDWSALRAEKVAHISPALNPKAKSRLLALPAQHASSSAQGARFYAGAGIVAPNNITHTPLK